MKFSTKALVVLAFAIVFVMATCQMAHSQELPTTATYIHDEDPLCEQCLSMIVARSVAISERPQPLTSSALPASDCSQPKEVSPALGADCSGAVRFQPKASGVCPCCGQSDCWRVTGEEPQAVRQREEISAGAAIGLAGIFIKLLFGGCSH